MRLVFLDSYFLTMLAVSLCTGMTILQRVVSICWIIFFVLWSAQAVKRGLPTHRLIQAALYSQMPALILVFTAPVASYLHVDGWTDGILALWETPFEPLFELLPGFHAGHFSSMYLEDCSAPFLILMLIQSLGWILRRV